MKYIMTTRQKQYLKGLAHKLNPGIQVGKDALSPSVLEAINKNLKDNELIKVQFLGSSGLDRKKDAETLARKVDADLVHVLGFKIILYRPNPDKKKPISLPS
ncbi:MAG: ribosome assembly RNA-binding protein YhbY [Fibrobacterota bacterium]